MVYVDVCVPAYFFVIAQTCQWRIYITVYLHEPRTSKKYNVNDWLVAGSPANNVRNCV